MKLILCCLAAGIIATSAQARPWKDSSGRTIEVVQWRVQGETVYFMINGKEVPEPLAKLSPEDQAFGRQWAEEHPAKPPHGAATAKPEPKESSKAGAKVEKLPNGDVIINLPSPPVEEEVRNYIPVTVILTLEKLYQWPTDMLALAKKMDWKPDIATWDERKYYFAAGKEAHARVLTADKFDFDEAARHLTKGQPLIVWRCWGKEHDEKLVAFNRTLQANPEAKLPSPRDAAERKTWPTDSSNSNAITSMVIGFNRQRGEVILAIPCWGPDYAAFRMRKEEMEVSTYAVWYFDPK
ncbi:MAG: hypothetical protein JWO89_3253 [Verrucomicrobiaceae bacterium]|nr:hypothetical protein [Verrucomicrobiaceae bacterium]